MGTILAILGLTLYIPLSMTGMLGVKKEYTEREESVDTTTEK